MIMNPPSHRILLASVNPCYPCFGIIHLCALASPIWMRMAGKSDPNFGVANRDQPEKCVVVVTVDTTGLVKGGAMPAAASIAAIAALRWASSATLAKSR